MAPSPEDVRRRRHKLCISNGRSPTSSYQAPPPHSPRSPLRSSSTARSVSPSLFLSFSFPFSFSSPPAHLLTLSRFLTVSLSLYLSLLFLRAPHPPFPIYTSVRMAWSLFHPNRDDRKHGDLLPRSQLNRRRFSSKRRREVCQRSTPADGCSAPVSPEFAWQRVDRPGARSPLSQDFRIVHW